MSKKALMLLLKAFKSEEWAESFLDGCLYCNTLRFHRERDDKQEGVIVIPRAKITQLKIGGLDISKDVRSVSHAFDIPSDYIKVVCMYSWAAPWVNEKEVFLDKETQLGSLRDLERFYGRYAVLLKDSPEFFSRLTRAVKHPNSLVIGTGRGLVRYSLLDEILPQEEIIRTAFHKNPKYAGEQEYRFAFLVKQHGPFRLNIGSIRDIAVLARTKDIYDTVEVNGSKDF